MTIPLPIEPPAKRQALQMRDYQAEAIAAVRKAWATGLNRPLVVLPTGGGKTVIFNLLADQYCDEVDPGGRVLMIAHRMELVAQAADKYRRFCGSERKIGIISAKMNRFDYFGQITFAGKDSLSDSRLRQLIAYGKIGLLIIDEAHHAPARTYHRVIEALLKVNPNLRILGLTATPMRADGVGLGGVFDVAPWNDKSGAVYQLNIGQLIAQHYLVNPNWLAIKTGISLDGVKTTRGDYNQQQLQNVFETPYTLDLVVRTHQQYALGKQAICFTISVNGVKEKDDDDGGATDGQKGDGGAVGLARRFNDAGIKAGYVHGEMSEVDRRRVLKQFEDKEIEVLCNCAVLTEGYDCPGIEVIHMVRPTKSDALYIQCMGRGLRPRNGYRAEDGERCLIFEYAPAKTRNLEMIGFLMGIPDDQQLKISKAQKALDRQVDSMAEGDVIASFGFNGEQIAMVGDGLGINALAIIATEINYFEESSFNWSKVDAGAGPKAEIKGMEGFNVLGLGSSPIDGWDRLLAIMPTPAGEYILYGLKHPPHKPPIYHPWQVQVLKKGNFETVSQKATEITDTHADSVLAERNKRWHSDPASPPQINKLLRSMGKRKLPPDLMNITKIEASNLINQYEAIAAIEKFEFVRQAALEAENRAAAAQQVKDQQTVMEV